MMKWKLYSCTKLVSPVTLLGERKGDYGRDAVILGEDGWSSVLIWAAQVFSSVVISKYGELEYVVWSYNLLIKKSVIFSWFIYIYFLFYNRNAASTQGDVRVTATVLRSDFAFLRWSVSNFLYLQSSNKIRWITSTKYSICGKDLKDFIFKCTIVPLSRVPPFWCPWVSTINLCTHLYYKAPKRQCPRIVYQQSQLKSPELINHSVLPPDVLTK